jgi:hypothetical protein
MAPLNISTWASLDRPAPDHVCPECGEAVVNRSPRDDLTPYQAHGLARPAWSHRDGTPLCPVMGPGGYQPADPTPRPARGAPRWSAGWNQPGYLPNPDAVTDFDDFGDAQAYLVSELDFAFELHDNDDARSTAIEEINALTGPGTVYAGGWAWWIHQAPDT